MSEKLKFNQIECPCDSKHCRGVATLNGFRFVCEGDCSNEGHIDHFPGLKAAINLHDELVAALKTIADVCCGESQCKQSARVALSYLAKSKKGETPND